MTEEEVRKIAHVYKQGLIGGSPRADRCCHAVHNDYGVSFHQCERKWSVERAGLRFCKTHDPVAVKRRRDERDAKLDAERDAMRLRAELAAARKAFEAACVDAIRAIAEGHNDPRSLAQEVLAKEPNQQRD